MKEQHCPAFFALLSQQCIFSWNNFKHRAKFISNVTCNARVCLLYYFHPMKAFIYLQASSKTTMCADV